MDKNICKDVWQKHLKSGEQKRCISNTSLYKKAFTLVELIVVITILAILATIGFVSFSGYLAGTRDTNRIAQLKSMSDALELYSTKKDLPIPDNKVDIKAGSEVIAYQGYIGKNVLETIEYTESGLDPKDKNYFSYYLTKNKKYFQLLAFLEEENQDKVAINNFSKTFATDYSERFPKTTGKKLGILTDEFNTPIQEITEINSETGSGYLDISDVGISIKYNSFFEGNDFITGTGTTFSKLNKVAKAGGKFCSTDNTACHEIKNGWLNIIKIDSDLDYLSDMGDISEISSTFYSDNIKGIGWGTNDDTYKNYIINKNYSQIKIIFSGDYNNPSGGLGKLLIDNENTGDSKEILILWDARTSSTTGQTLKVNSNTIYDKEEHNESNREEEINYGDSNLLKIQMKGPTSSYPYTKRFIKELWVK